MKTRANPATFSTLRRLGFSDYEARAYLAVLAEGPAEARALADAADVPVSRIHAVLSDLAQRGWVEVERSRPLQYAAADPAGRLAREWDDAQREQEAALAELTTLHRGAAEPAAEPAQWIVDGEDAVRERALRLFRGAEKEVLWTLPFLLPGDPEERVPAAVDAARRGAKVRVLLGPAVLPHVAQDPQWTLLVHAGAEVRTSTFPARVLVADFRAALMEMRPSADSPVVHGLWNPLEPFVHMMRPALEGFWRDGVSLAEAARAPLRS